MNAPVSRHAPHAPHFEDPVLRAIYNIASSTGLSETERIIAVLATLHAQLGNATWQGVPLRRGDVAWCAGFFATESGRSVRHVGRALASLDDKQVLPRTRKRVGTTLVRVVRPLLAADEGRDLRIGGAIPSLTLARPKKPRRVRKRPNSSGTNSSTLSNWADLPNWADQHVGERTNSSDLPPTNSADNSSGVLSSSESDPPSLPITHGETAREEGDEVSIEQPDAPCVEPLPRTAPIDRDRGTPNGSGPDRASESLKDAIRRIASQPSTVWSNDPAKRLQLLQIDSDPTNPKNVRTKPPLISHAEFSWRRGEIDAWGARRFAEAVKLEAAGTNPLARGSGSGATPEEKAKFKEHQAALAAAAQQHKQEIVVDPTNFLDENSSTVDLGAMQLAWKAKAAEAGERGVQ